MEKKKKINRSVCMKCGKKRDRKFLVTSGAPAGRGVRWKCKLCPKKVNYISK